MRMGNIVSGREPEVPSLEGSLLSIDYAARPWRRHNNAQPPHDWACRNRARTRAMRPYAGYAVATFW